MRNTVALVGPVIVGLVIVGIIAIPPLEIAPRAYGHTGAKGVVKERMDLMQTLAKSVKAIKGAMVAPGAPTAAGRKTIAAGAAVIEGHALRMLKMFPAGSGAHPSEALPSIWKDWPGFRKSARALATAAGKLKTSAATADRSTLFKGFAALARTCGG